MKFPSDFCITAYLLFKSIFIKLIRGSHINSPISNSLSFRQLSRIKALPVFQPLLVQKWWAVENLNPQSQP